MTHGIVRERKNDEQETIEEDGAGPSQASGGRPMAGALPARGYREHRVERGGYGIYAREYEGKGPALVLLHGFPDNLRLHDRLIPHLGARRIITFDFLGWGSSNKPPDWPYSFAGLTADVDAVVRRLGLDLSRYAERWGNIAARALARPGPQRTVGLALGVAYRLLLAGRPRHHGG